MLTLLPRSAGPNLTAADALTHQVSWLRTGLPATTAASLRTERNINLSPYPPKQVFEMRFRAEERVLTNPRHIHHAQDVCFVHRHCIPA